MRKIIIPTDFSANAFNALQYAVELFKHERSEIFLLHTYADEVYNYQGMLTPTLLEELKQKAHESSTKKLEDIISRIQSTYGNPNHNFKSLSIFGLLVDEINELVNSENADVIVMGTRGETNDRLIAFGSNTVQVIKYLVCPVLCIPENFRYKEPEHILFPSDCLIPYNKRELKLVAEIARNFAAHVHMLFISKKEMTSHRQLDNLNLIKKQFYDIQIQTERIEGNGKTKLILNYAEKITADLLVMVNSRQTYLEGILYRSTIDKIGLHPTIPFLVLQNFSRNEF